MLARVVGLKAPMTAVPRNSGLAEMMRPAPGPSTSPEMGIDCGLFPALSVRINDAVRVPVADADGLKTRKRSQPSCPRGIGLMQVPLEEIWKSAALAPPMLAPVIASGRSAWLATRISLPGLAVPAAWAEKTIGLGLTESAAPCPAVPDKLIVCDPMA